MGLHLLKTLLVKKDLLKSYYFRTYQLYHNKRKIASIFANFTEI